LDIRTSKILDICYDIEETCASIYLYYAGVFEKIPEMHALWHKTAMEEFNHANAIRLAMGCRDMDCREKNRDLSRYENARTRVREVAAHVRKTPPTLEDALRSSILLEKKLNEFHVACVLDFEDSSAKKLFQALLDGDTGHVESLEDAYRNLVLDRIEALHASP